LKHRTGGFDFHSKQNSVSTVSGIFKNEQTISFDLNPGGVAPFINSPELETVGATAGCYKQKHNSGNSRMV
jgi:hypothetical protein